MYFSYKVYKKCIPATICSFAGGASVAGGIATAVASGMSGEMDGVIGGAVIAVIGAGLYVLAGKIAERKRKKMEQKEARKAEAAAIEASSNTCRSCGATLAPDDVFCYNCGTKRSS